jgi:hypothetical protein
MRRFWVSTRSRVHTSVELLRALWSGPFWWLVPVVLLLLPAAVVFIFLQSAPLVAPFVYTVF